MAKFSQGFMDVLSRTGTPQAAMQQGQQGPSDYGSLQRNLGAAFNMDQRSRPEMASAEIDRIDPKANDALRQSLLVSAKYEQDPQRKILMLAKVAELDKLAAEEQEKKKTRAITEGDLAKLHKNFTPESILQYFNKQGPLVPLTKENISTKDQADLYKDYTAVSINAFLAGKGPLIPLDKKEKENLTEFEKVLKSGNFTDEEKVELNSARAQRLASGDVTREDPVNLGITLKNDVIALPTYMDMEKLTTASNKTLGALDLYDQSDKTESSRSELLRVIERSSSDLFNGQSKAASEITRFLEGKGIKRSVQDWFTTVIGGDLSPDSVANLREIATLAEKFSNTEKNRIASAYFKGLDPYLPDATKKILNSSLSTNLRLSNVVVDFNDLQ